MVLNTCISGVMSIKITKNEWGQTTRESKGSKHSIHGVMGY